jgi:DNA-binding NarL/FixJ family response regulator
MWWTRSLWRFNSNFSRNSSRCIRPRGELELSQPDRAVAELERAAATFELWGAARYRDEAERELRKLGRRIHRRTRPGDAEDGVASLTRRELDVARLVSKGKSNPEIAAELFLSPKTVESHIRNLFFKLGASSRVEVARVVERSRG